MTRFLRRDRNQSLKTYFTAHWYTTTQSPQNRPFLGPWRRCPPSKPRPTEQQIRAESQVTIETYTERHTIFVISEASAARGLRDVARRQASPSRYWTRLPRAKPSTGHDGANWRRLAHCRTSRNVPRHSLSLIHPAPLRPPGGSPFPRPVAQFPGALYSSSIKRSVLRSIPASAGEPSRPGG